MAPFITIKAGLKFLKFWRVPKVSILFKSYFSEKLDFTWEGLVAKDATKVISFAQQNHSSKVPNRIVWMVPEASEFGGGFRTLSRFIRYFDKIGFSQEIAIYSVSATDLTKQKWIWHGYFRVPKSISVSIASNSYPENNYVIATGWQTVYKVCSVVPFSQRIWFMQDDESLFFSSGTIRNLIETANKHFPICITAGPWLKKLALLRGTTEAFDFEFGYDEIYFHNSNSDSSRRNIVVGYFQADKSWRLSFEILESIKAFLDDNPAWRAVLVGDDIATKMRLPSRITAIGKVSPIDLSYLYSKAKIGVVGSASNASLVPYEMLASGLKVVTNKGENSEWLAKANFPISYVEPTHTGFRDGIIQSSQGASNLTTFNLLNWDQVLQSFAQKFSTSTVYLQLSSKNHSDNIQE